MADSSEDSLYVDDDFYGKLVEDFADWQRDDLEFADPAVRDECLRLLEREARLLESGRLEDWLGLFSRDCLYWVPATPGGGDPRDAVQVAFDDRRRLEDRIFRLADEHAWSQRPASRTSRIVSNVAVFTGGDDEHLMVRSTFLTTEYQAGGKRTHAGWCGHRLRRRPDGSWEIVVKQVNLIDCDANLRNPSIIL